MTEKTDPPPSVAQAPLESVSSPAFAAKPQKKPRFALFVATAAGLGYIPLAPGTWGSLAAVGITYLSGKLWGLLWIRMFFPRLGGNANVNEPWMFFGGFALDSRVVPLTFLAIGIAVLGVWASGRASQFARNDDPQFVVIDEVSGQLLAFVLALAPANWKYLLLGFILFRVFDIWKPFPARQAESLPGGWGIMTDDWVAGIYAALGLWVARALGL
jgi:phosphatidylglycerophosphatase A